MRIAIISDIHGNFDSLSSLPSDYDELWVLGDLVNYGPQPAEVVDWVRSYASLVIRGNHDHAVGFDSDPRCTVQFRQMAAETMEFSQSVLPAGAKEYLAFLPTSLKVTRGHASFYLCHATVADPLFGYREKNSPDWDDDLKQVDANFLLAGHTHVPFMRKSEKGIIANPGSLGQPKTGNAAACYAVWQDGRLKLKTYEYAVDRTEKKILSLPVSPNVQKKLIEALHGASPSPFQEV